MAPTNPYISGLDCTKNWLRVNQSWFAPLTLAQLKVAAIALTSILILEIRYCSSPLTYPSISQGLPARPSHCSTLYIRCPMWWWLDECSSYTRYSQVILVPCVYAGHITCSLFSTCANHNSPLFSWLSAASFFFHWQTQWPEVRPCALRVIFQNLFSRPIIKYIHIIGGLSQTP